MRRYVVKEYGHPAVLHVCELDEHQRPGEPLCRLAGGVTLEYPSGAIDCLECHSLAASRGRNRQERAFDLSDAEDEC